MNGQGLSLRIIFLPFAETLVSGQCLTTLAPIHHSLLPRRIYLLLPMHASGMAVMHFGQRWISMGSGLHMAKTRMLRFLRQS